MMTSSRPISFRRCRTVCAAVASSRSLAVIQHDYDAAPFVSDGVIDVDSFTSFYTSVRNRRMSRAGNVLEIHIAHILDARGIEYEAQAKTENGKKPDFLFPSQAAYEDPAFPEEQLRMLPSKTSIKDRFR